MLEFKAGFNRIPKEVREIQIGTTFRWGTDNKDYLMTERGIIVIPEGIQSDYPLEMLNNYRETTIVCEVREI